MRELRERWATDGCGLKYERLTRFKSGGGCGERGLAVKVEGQVRQRRVGERKYEGVKRE